MINNTSPQLQHTPITIAPAKDLAQYGVYRTLDARIVPILLLALAILVPLLVFWMFRLSPSVDYATRIATVMAACFAMILGYHQWRASRHDASIDKYYDRLDALDRRLDSSESARALVSHFWAGSSLFSLSYEEAMYIYAELDILEYSIEKYRMGFMSSMLALRAVNSFRSRCRSEIFSQQAAFLVRYAGYTPRTINAVTVITSHHHREMK